MNVTNADIDNVNRFFLWALLNTKHPHTYCKCTEMSSLQEETKQSNKFSNTLKWGEQQWYFSYKNHLTHSLSLWILYNTSIISTKTRSERMLFSCTALNRLSWTNDEKCLINTVHWLIKVLRPTRHKIGHFRDVLQANLLAWYRNTTQAHIHQSKEMYYNTK